jgi:hypothetical protein
MQNDLGLVDRAYLGFIRSAGVLAPASVRTSQP